MRSRCLSLSRPLLGAALLLLFAAPARPAAARPERLRVSADGRYLETTSGRPFFYLADTAWELFHRPTREEADLYLRDRASKGFTAVQAVVLPELRGPNAYGHVPLVGDDPARPVEAWFRHVDWVVGRAERLGLYVAMLPTWGDRWNKKWGAGPEIFTPANAEAYGEFLGRRYRDRAVIWVLGGDRSPESGRHLEIVRALARGLARGDGGAHLTTYHPMGGTNSATFFRDDPWIDFHMIQSGHSTPNEANYGPLLANRALAPARPTLDGEPRYEDHPIDWDPKKGWFDAWDVRQAAWWAVFSGACGHTYGDHDIWQFWQPGREPVSAARTPWREALGHPGARQMGFMRRFLESLPYTKLVPDAGLLADGAGSGADYVAAARASDGSFLVAYVPTGKPITVRLSTLSGPDGEAAWFDPRTGVRRRIGALAGESERRFTPPSAGRGNDWVLVIDFTPGAQKRDRR
jgi:hypothetical protein